MEHFFGRIEGWFTFPQLYSFLVSRMPAGGTFVEVGSWKGQSLAYLAVEAIRQGKDFRIVAVDTWEGSSEHAGTSSIRDGTLYEEFTRNLEPVAGRYEALRLPSLEAAKSFGDASLDAVFIDAAHEYAAVAADLEAWHPKVKPGGWVCGHDYSKPWPGVIRAVDRFFAQHPGQLLAAGPEFCWVARKS